MLNTCLLKYVLNVRKHVKLTIEKYETLNAFVINWQVELIKTEVIANEIEKINH